MRDPRPARVARLVVPLLVALASTGACGSSDDAAAESSSASAAPMSAPASSSTAAPSTGTGMPAAVVTITIEDFGYRTPTSVGPGATVQVTNADGEAHSVTADGGAFNLNTPPGQTVSFTAPTQPGSYPFHCLFHGNMHGVLVVQ